MLLGIMLFGVKQVEEISDEPQDTVVQTPKYLLWYQECNLKIKAYEMPPKNAQAGVLLMCISMSK